MDDENDTNPVTGSNYLSQIFAVQEIISSSEIHCFVHKRESKLFYIRLHRHFCMTEENSR